MNNMEAHFCGKPKQLASSKNNTEKLTTNKECNCRVKAGCLFHGNWLKSCIIYQAIVKTNDSVETYINMTETDFKTSKRNHAMSF